ncbi:Glucosidase 2 subunit beta [Aphelenchoides fujianensis]|nr:Glucosidase 2 subunit beta [Aphelenchoides fujianensis]
MAVQRPFLLFLLVAFAAIAAANDEAYGNRPRGVSAEKASLYEEAEEFQCLDGSKKIPFERVNDDYCDCADGSDEPGTSACPNGRFHCRNHGFRPMELPSSRVNDFVCDCCDGSDEWDSGVQCPNVCHEMGAQARQAADERKAIVEKGWAKRSELAKEGAKSMDEKRAELEKMKKELDDLQPLKSAAEQAKQDAEQRENDAKNEEDRQWNEQLEEKRKTEADELWSKIDIDKDGKITIEDFKAAAKTLAERELDDEEVRSIFGEELELLAEKFREKLLDLRRFFRKLTTERPTAVTEPPPTEEPRSPPPEGEELKDADEEADDLNDDSLEPEPVRDERDDEDDGDRFDERKPDYSEATRNLIEEANKQRDHHRETTNKIHDLERDIRDAENFLEFEYGPDGAWAPLKGQCPEMNQAQYTYRLCLFDRAVQKDRNGHHEIGIGNWRGWDGPESDKYSVQKYADGQHCWNGPARSTRVHVECGAELELYDVKEPAKCEYEFRLRSPAACPDPATLKDPFAVHTEL